MCFLGYDIIKINYKLNANFSGAAQTRESVYLTGLSQSAIDVKAVIAKGWAKRYLLTTWAQQVRVSAFLSSDKCSILGRNICHLLSDLHISVPKNAFLYSEVVLSIKSVIFPLRIADPPPHLLINSLISIIDDSPVTKD